MNVGFVGLGAMGLPMTRHLVEAGHRVTVASRSPGPVERAASFGAKDGVDPTHVAEASEVVILCAPELAAGRRGGRRDASFPRAGPDRGGLLHHRPRSVPGPAPEGGVDRRRLPRRTAVGRDCRSREKGSLTLMVGGDEETLEAARPALDPFAGLVVHVGGPGMGQVVKLCNNLIYAAQMLATAEAAALAVTSGVDMASSSRSSPTRPATASRSGPALGRRCRAGQPGVQRMDPGFMTDLMAKDLDLALAYAVGAGVSLETTKVARVAVEAASEAGYGREDFSAVAKVVFARSGLE